MRSETLAPDKIGQGNLPQHRGVLALTYLLCAFRVYLCRERIYQFASLGIRPEGTSISIVENQLCRRVSVQF